MLIPKANEEHDNYPCWISVVTHKGNKPIKPVIRCKCGKYCGIGKHHVHADGRITASFFHRDGAVENDNKGCGFHEHIELENWIGLDFPPE